MRGLHHTPPQAEAASWSRSSVGWCGTPDVLRAAVGLHYSMMTNSQRGVLPTQEGEQGSASPGLPAGATATVRVTAPPSPASAKATAASPSPAAVSPKRWRRLTGSAAAAPKAAAASVRSTPAAIRTAPTAGDQAQSGSPLGWGRAAPQPPSPVSPAMAAAQALFTSPLSRTATHPPAAAMAAAGASADPQLRRTLSADVHSGPQWPLHQSGHAVRPLAPGHADESPPSSPASERPLQGGQQSASPFTSSPSSTGDKENDDDIDTEIDTGELHLGARWQLHAFAPAV